MWRQVRQLISVYARWKAARPLLCIFCREGAIMVALKAKQTSAFCALFSCKSPNPYDLWSCIQCLQTTRAVDETQLRCAS